MEQKKILVIEDESDMVYALTLLLENQGYKVISAGDGKQGLDKARTEKPDLIILDLMLPKIEGYKVCRLLKFDEKYKHIPVVMLTARAQEKDRVLGKEVGADFYFSKPFKGELLLEKIRELITGP